MNSTGFGTTQEVGEPPVKIMSSTPPVTHARKNPAGSVALRPKQLCVLMAVRRLTARLGVPPARSELAKELGLQSQGSIDGHLLTLNPTSPTQREFCRFSLFSTTQVIELLESCTPNSPQYRL